MNKSQFNVLIVEDDVTQGKALYEAFTRAGYTAILCATSVQALTQAQRTEFHCMIVDCMLPRMNGIDLLEEISAMIPNQPKVFLTTGIYKDRKFMHEAVKRTKAENLFIKPLNLESILGHVENALRDLVQASSPPLIKIYSSESIDDSSMIKLIEQDSTLHAFHLPMLLQRIHDTTMTGDLTLIMANGDVSSIGFHTGRVFSVKTPDKDSYFGSLAVSHGFVSPQEVMDALKDPSGKMLGDKLIESMSLSPHAIEVILEEQLTLRLSQCIQDNMISLQWVSKNLPPPHHNMADTKFEFIIEDWLQSKITPGWIKTTLMSWGPYQIEGDYHPRIRGSRTIEDVFSDANFNEEKDVPDLFQALVRGRAFMGSRGAEVKDFTFLESRLDQMANDFKRQNYFQFMGLSEKAHTREVSKAYESLKEAFHPSSLPVGCPPELREKCASVFALIEKSKSILADDVERLRYLQQLQNRRGQQILEAEPIFRTAILEIMSGHAAQAGKKFQSLLDRKLEFKDLRAYRIWAGLKENRHFSSLRMDQIPPEERHSAPYMMARGVYYRTRGQYKKALDAYRTAHVLDPTLRIAIQELKNMVRDIEKQRGNNRELIREVAKVAQSLFGKKSA